MIYRADFEFQTPEDVATSVARGHNIIFEAFATRDFDADYAATDDARRWWLNRAAALIAIGRNGWPLISPNRWRRS